VRYQLGFLAIVQRLPLAGTRLRKSLAPQCILLPTLFVATTSALAMNEDPLPNNKVKDAIPAERPRFAGPVGASFLLPNGWTITPVGKQVGLTDLPLNIVPLADGRHALVATSGFNRHELSLIDLMTQQVLARHPAGQSWFGLAVAPQMNRVWWSGGGANFLHTINLEGRKLTGNSPIGRASPKQDGFKSGVALDPGGETLYSLDINAGTITAIRLKDGVSGKPAACGRRPYDVAMARNGSLLYVSDWAGAAILALDPRDLRVVAQISVGEHPNQIAIHPSDDRLFVACASSNCVSVIDTKRGVLTETMYTALFPKAPTGSTPDALALAPDGKTLYVANADNNCIAVFDIARPMESRVKGFVPTGWYPTAVAVSRDGKSLLVGVGKGDQTRANPIDMTNKSKDDNYTPYGIYPSDNPGDIFSPRRFYPYIGSTLSGALSIVPVPDEKQFADYTATVYRNCPYSDKLLANAPSPHATAIPTNVGSVSPIKHVIYIIKENRTYDQVFGDMKEGNGDASLCLFPEKITPNHHKLARQFVLLDNLYCNGHVSWDGHPWATMAYNTDYTARDWCLVYSGRKGIRDDDEGNLTKAPAGHLWDACARNKLSYRNYGEGGTRAKQSDGTFRMEGGGSLFGHICPHYGVPTVVGASVRDTENVEVFLNEFRNFEQNGQLPNLIIMSLGEDHTYGTAPGANTPQACVASNDLALGRLVEAVAKSKYWPKTAIFVIEDDAQNGPDHVDAHRTVGLVISPYTKRHYVDSNQYSTVSMVRTIELILGLPPLSQYDAAARPMFASFTNHPALTPFVHEGARIDLSAVNRANAYGADRSSKMDFSDYDKIDDFELNEVLWRAIKGKDAPLPPAVRRAIADRPFPLLKQIGLMRLQ
jgi:YVTN family beta-propeller protein